MYFTEVFIQTIESVLTYTPPKFWTHEIKDSTTVTILNTAAIYRVDQLERGMIGKHR